MPFYAIIYFSIYTLSDLGVLSNLIVLFCFVSFYWANLPRGKEHEQDSGPMRGAPPYTIQKDQRDRPQHRELRALLFSMSVWVL